MRRCSCCSIVIGAFVLYPAILGNCQRLTSAFEAPPDMV
jgi:hypothetical protein